MIDEDQIEIHRGLKGVYLDRSGTSSIDGRAGELRYRGYSIHDLAEHSSFEETAYLLLHGELPTRAELDAFDAELKAARTLPGAVYDVIRAVKDAHPMEVLRTAVSALAAFDGEAADTSPEATRIRTRSRERSSPVASRILASRREASQGGERGRKNSIANRRAMMMGR